MASFRIRNHTILEHIGRKLWWLYCGRNPEANLATRNNREAIAAAPDWVFARLTDDSTGTTTTVRSTKTKSPHAKKLERLQEELGRDQEHMECYISLIHAHSEFQNAGEFVTRHPELRQARQDLCTQGGVLVRRAHVNDNRQGMFNGYEGRCLVVNFTTTSRTSRTLHDVSFFFLAKIRN